MKLKELKLLGKNLNPNLPLEEQKNVTLIEYISIALSRIGGMFGTTLTGTLATTFLYELYFVNKPEVSTEQIAGILAFQTTLTTILGIILPLLAGILVQKWKSRYGRYRHWYFIYSVPLFILTVSFYWVPPESWSVPQMTYLRYFIASFTTVITAFNNLSQNLIQVVTPNYKEKKSIATLWQISYYIGYGLAYLSPEIFKIFIPKNDPRYTNRYIILTAIAATLTLIGNFMCGINCRERIELPQKPKTKLSKEMFMLFKYRNYRAYQYVSWAAVFSALGKWSTLLAGITVGSSNIILLTVPTAAGTVVGNLVCGVIAKKYEPTKILRWTGLYSVVAASVLFGLCYGEKVMGIYFWQGWTAIFFYIFYFLFGVGVGFQELSTSHFTAEFYDYLEWQTGERLEAVQGIIPGWINSGISYLKELLIPFILVWISYPVAEKNLDLIGTIEYKISNGTLTQSGYLSTCLWLVALLVFGYAVSGVLRAAVLKFLYDVEGNKKIQMYKELEEIRRKRHDENVALSENN